MMRRWWVVGASAMSLLAATAPTQAADSVTLITPQYDAPGATVPVLVSAVGVEGRQPRFSVRASGAATVWCADEVWRSGRRAGRRCYVDLPRTAGPVRLTATVRDAGGVVRSGPRTVAAKGVPAGKVTRAQVRQIETCRNATDDVWLTFDDTATWATLRPILRTLAKANVRGRFFWIGAWARKNPEMVRAVKKRGHLLLNHTDTHAALSSVSNRRVRAEVRRGPQSPPRAPLLRPPYGAGSFSDRVAEQVRAEGHELCRWTVDTHDWDGSSPRTMIRRVRFGDAYSPPVRPGAVVLMHSSVANTTRALPGIIRAIRAEGLRLEPLHAAQAHLGVAGL